MNFLHAIRGHGVFRNATALGVMQVANYAVPLMVLPFLTRQLGLEAFGVVAVTLAAIQLSFVLTDYGFSLSATYDISLNRDNVELINKKIGAIFGAKILLLGLLAIPSSILIILKPELNSHAPFYWAALLAVIAQAFQPTWLFQGIERMKSITIYTALSRIVYAVLVFLVVSQPKDAVLVIHCWSAAQITGLVISIYLIYSHCHKISLPTLSSITHELREGAQFFWSRLAVALYTSASTLIVGSHSPAQAAQFSVCEQIYKAGQNITSPINTAMFPYMAKTKDWRLFFKTLTGTALIMTAGCTLLAFWTEPLLVYFFGNEYAAASPTLIVLLCTTVINYVAVTFGYSAFAALGRIEIANTSVITGAIIHAAALAIIYKYFEINALSIATAILSTELCVMLIRIYYFIKIKKTKPTSF